MMGNSATRRMVTITAVVLSFALWSALLPLLLTAAVAFDAVRYVMARRHAVAVRFVVFGWIYLLGEIWALPALAFAALAGTRSVDLTYRLQNAWASWNFATFRVVFDVRFQVEGVSLASPGPVVVLARHASLVDSLLPVVLLAQPASLHLRYVLKRELLVDPALDIAGNRLPNHFIDRKAPDTDSELQALRSLASGIGVRDGVVIFPEGTRFTEAKRDRIRARNAGKSGVVSELAASYRGVLPPRPAGTLAILDATPADVLVLAHRGLEGFATVADAWSGGLVGSRVAAKIWRIPGSEVPSGRSERVEWLHRVWADVDAWVTGARAAVADG